MHNATLGDSLGRDCHLVCIRMMKNFHRTIPSGMPPLPLHPPPPSSSSARSEEDLRIDRTKMAYKLPLSSAEGHGQSRSECGGRSLGRSTNNDRLFRSELTPNPPRPMLLKPGPSYPDTACAQL